MSSPDLMDKMGEQARTYGAVIKTGEEVVNITKESDLFTVETKTTRFLAKTVVLTTGSTYKRLNIPG